MRKPAIISSLLLLSAASLSAQLSPIRYASPQAELQQLLKIGDSGALLTPEGWKQATPLFAHPRPLPHDTPITVIGDDYSLHEIWTRGNQAEFYVTYRDLGRIDSSLRYSPPDARFPKVVVRYHLLLISKSIFARGGTREVASPREWRITTPQMSLWIGLNAAAQYVAEQHYRADDPSLKRNARITLEELKRIK